MSITSDQNRELSSNKSSPKKWFGMIGLLALTIAKGWKFILFFLKFAKFHTLISMLLAVWVYATMFGWPFAVGFVLLIFVHELGHALVMKNEGIPASAPVFIPFVGAVIAMQGMPRDAWVEAKVGYGGPLLGTIGAILVFIAGYISSSSLLMALAHTGFLINLFNMIPVSPMDGGRIAGGISKAFLVAGLGIGFIVFWQIRSPLLLVMLILGAFRVWQIYKNPLPGYFEIPMQRRLTMGVAYLGLLAILFLGLELVQPWLAHLNDSEKLGLALGATITSLATMIKSFLKKSRESPPFYEKSSVT